MQRIGVGDRVLIHDARRQQLFQLNDTADLIWRDLAGGGSPKTAASRLAALGLPTSEGLRFAAEAAQAWMLEGLLAPRAALDALSGPPAAARTLALDELAVRLEFYGEVPAADLDAAFGQFYGPLPRPARRLSVVAHEGLFCLFLDGELLATARPHGLAAEIKAALTELYVQGVEGAFLAHGALLARNGRTAFLSGAPGAGKTTLTLALAAAGWAYGGDDIVRFEPDGRARGAPFAAAVKSGAWPLLGRLWPDLETLPAWLRADGQTTRYLLPPALAERTPSALDLVLLLERRANACAELQPVEPVEALSAILESAYAARWRMDGTALEALGRTLEAAVCRRLVYSDLAGAVAAIDGLAGV